MDIGSQLGATLLDGRIVEGKLTFGDIARAEAATGINYLQKFRSTEDVSMNDVAQLTFQIGRRTQQFTGSWDDYLLLLDNFVVPDETSNGNGNSVDPTRPVQ